MLTFLGWGSLYVPENLLRFMQLALLVSALACAHPLRKVLSRARPLGLSAKFVVFSLVLALWFSSLLPLLMIVNVKLDSSAPKQLERPVLETEERGINTCKVKIDNWDDSGSADPHWLWLECPHPHQNVAGKTTVAYTLRKGGLGFAWVSEMKLKH